MNDFYLQHGRNVEDQVDWLLFACEDFDSKSEEQVS